MMHMLTLIVSFVTQVPAKTNPKFPLKQDVLRLKYAIHVFHMHLLQHLTLATVLLSGNDVTIIML